MMLFDSVAKLLRDISVAVALIGMIPLSGISSAALTGSINSVFRTKEPSHISVLSDATGDLGFEPSRMYMARLGGELNAIRRVLEVIGGDKFLLAFCNDYLNRLVAIFGEAMSHQDLLSHRIPTLISSLSTSRRALLDDALDARTWSILAQAFTGERWVKLPDRFIGPSWSQQSDVDVEAIMSGARLRTLET